MIDKFKEDNERFIQDLVKIGERLRAKMMRDLEHGVGLPFSEPLVSEMQELQKIMLITIHKSLGTYIAFTSEHPHGNAKVLTLFTSFMDMLSEILPHFDMNLFNVIHKDTAGDVIEVCEYLFKKKKEGKLDVINVKNKMGRQISNVLNKVRKPSKIKLVD
jgi:hypothetical protein